MQGGLGGGSSASGSMSTVSREDNMVLSSEDSSYPDETELELGLGLSLGGGFRGHRASRGQYARILTAKDFPSVGSSSSSSPSSSSSSSSSSRVNVTAGTKRTADSVAAANGAGGQVVGWPPIRAYRMNSMVNQAKTVATEELNSTIEKNRNKNGMVEKIDNGGYKSNGNTKVRTSLFVKVNMYGIAIGRKVDLNAHGCYETLAQTLVDMFLRSPTTFNAIRSSTHEHSKVIETRPSKLLGGSSEFVLTYEDKDGDWMLVGDVPWGMFLSSVKRLRIMRTSEATGLAPRLQERNGRQAI